MVLSVIIASVASMVFGFIWFSPILFGKKWMELSGLITESMSLMKGHGMAKIYIGNFAMEIITAFVLFNFLRILDVSSSAGGVEIALWLWFGFVLPIEVGQTLWMKKPIMLLLINSLHRLGSITIIALILTSFF